ncbi:MAG: ATP-binding protein [Gammaproteobacteria bacterium]
MIENTLKTILLDFQELEITPSTPRDLIVKPIPKKASICIGVRRSGKSTYLFQCIEKLLADGIAKEQIVYINFFDDRLHGLQRNNLHLILDVYYQLYPEHKDNKTVYYFFDEIQVCEGWEAFVDRLLRTEKCEIYITGSSAKMLSKEIATRMRGRSLSWEMFPFSFKEFLAHKKINPALPLSTKKKAFVRKGFEQFWMNGGFPEVTELGKQTRIRVHQEYFHSILFNDLIERHNITHPKALTDLAYWLIDNIGSMYTINRLANYLKSLGHKIPKQSVSQYIEWFEDAYFLFTIRIFDASLAKANTNPKKIYCIDHAIITSIASDILVNSGHLLENVVFVALRRQHSKIYYYKTRTGKEVDFIIQTDKRKRLLIQVSETLIDEQTRKREVDALTEAMHEIPNSSGIIVTRSEHHKIETSAGVIDVIPIWLYLLEIEQ